jgi:hypothetical protein
MPENVNESEGQRGLQAALSISEAAKVNRWAFLNTNITA